MNSAEWAATGLVITVLVLLLFTLLASRSRARRPPAKELAPK